MNWGRFNDLILNILGIFPHEVHNIIFAWKGGHQLASTHAK